MPDPDSKAFLFKEGFYSNLFWPLMSGDHCEDSSTERKWGSFRHCTKVLTVLYRKLRKVDVKVDGK